MNAEVERKDMLIYELGTLFESPLLSAFRKSLSVFTKAIAPQQNNVEQFECHINKSEFKNGPCFLEDYAQMAIL